MGGKTAESALLCSIQELEICERCIVGKVKSQDKLAS